MHLFTRFYLVRHGAVYWAPFSTYFIQLTYLLWLTPQPLALQATLPS